MYTLWATVAVVGVVTLELAWARTGLFRRRSFWVTILITWAFQVPVDGWLTKLSAPIVIYNPTEFSGIRFPWDIPVEDFAYGFALVTLVLMFWLRDASSRRTAPARSRPGEGAIESGRAESGATESGATER